MCEVCRLAHLIERIVEHKDYIREEIELADSPMGFFAKFCQDVLDDFDEEPELSEEERKDQWEKYMLATWEPGYEYLRH